MSLETAEVQRLKLTFERSHSNESEPRLISLDLASSFTSALFCGRVSGVLGTGDVAWYVEIEHRSHLSWCVRTCDLDAGLL